MHLNYGKPLNQTKMCSLCQSKSCIKGEYLVNPDDRLRQKWVCKACIVKANSPYIKKCIQVGTLNADKMTRARLTHTCPSTCGRLGAGGQTCYGGEPPQKPKEIEVNKT